MKLMLLMFAIICSGLAQAALEVGTYKGSDNNNNRFELHIQALPEREGSFLGLLVNDDETKVRAYLIDGFSSSKYGLLSMRLTGNYNIGVSNTLPTLALTVTDHTLVMTANGNDNDMSFSSSITFRTKDKLYLRWSPLISGNYASKKMVISNLDADNESTVTSKLPGHTGDFVLRETRKDMYIMLSSQLTATGIKLGKDATKFAVFLKGSRFSANKMLLVDSDTGSAVALKNK